MEEKPLPQEASCPVIRSNHRDVIFLLKLMNALPPSVVGGLLWESADHIPGVVGIPVFFLVLLSCCLLAGWLDALPAASGHKRKLLIGGALFMLAVQIVIMPMLAPWIGVLLRGRF